MSDWQPIETAPKDGTLLLLWLEDEHRPIVGHWGQPMLLAPCAEQWTDGVYALAEVSAWLPIPRREA